MSKNGYLHVSRWSHKKPKNKPEPVLAPVIEPDIERKPEVQVEEPKPVTEPLEENAVVAEVVEEKPKGDLVMVDDVKPNEVQVNQNDSFVVEVPEIPMPAEGIVDSDIVKDECDVAFKFAFVGIGQCGARLAESFWKLGYRRVCAINTNQQDLAAIKIPDANKLIMDIGHGGAGKDPAKGKQAAEKYKEDIYDLMRKSFGKEFDRIFVCAGAGGGSGTGGCLTVVEIAHEIARSSKVETDDGITAVGAIVSLPRVTEGGKVNANAHSLLDELFVKTGDRTVPPGKTQKDGRSISPLIVVDNDRINKIYPNLPVLKFWDTANQSFTSLFHLFNSIAVRDSDFTTFDRADLKDILEGGVTTFGACPIRKWNASTDISFAIRDNLRSNVLVGGFDFSKAKSAGCVFIGSSDVLQSIPQEHLEHGFEMLSRIMRPGSVVHRGIYRGNKQGLVVYSIIAELGRPEERMAEMAKVGNVK